MAQTNRSTTTPDLASTVFSMLSMSNHLAAAPALETAASSRQPVSVPPPYQQDERSIAQGHAERRLLLAQRRAEQQVALTIEAWCSLGHVVTPGQARMLAGVAVTAYTDTLAAARR